MVVRIISEVRIIGRDVRQGCMRDAYNWSRCSSGLYPTL